MQFVSGDVEHVNLVFLFLSTLVLKEKDWLLQVDAHLTTADSLVVQESIALLHFGHFELRQVLEDYSHGSEALNDAEADFRVVESELAA